MERLGRQQAQKNRSTGRDGLEVGFRKRWKTKEVKGQEGLTLRFVLEAQGGSRKGQEEKGGTGRHGQPRVKPRPSWRTHVAHLQTFTFGA